MFGTKCLVVIPLHICVRRDGFLKYPSNSLTSVWCPIIHSLLTTVYSDIAWDPTDWKLSPTRLPFASDASSKSRLSSVLLIGWLQIGVPMTRSLGFGHQSQVCLFQTPVTSPDCYLYFWEIGYKSEVPMTSSLGSINLLEHLEELRKLHLLTRLLAYYNRY